MKSCAISGLVSSNQMSIMTGTEQSKQGTARCGIDWKLLDFKAVQKAAKSNQKLMYPQE